MQVLLTIPGGPEQGTPLRQAGKHASACDLARQDRRSGRVRL